MTPTMPTSNMPSWLGCSMPIDFMALIAWTIVVAALAGETMAIPMVKTSNATTPHAKRRFQIVERDIAAVVMTLSVIGMNIPVPEKA